MKIEFNSEAESELTLAFDCYESESAGTGHRLLLEVERALRLLSEQPRAGAPVDPNLRRCLLRRFPFALYYSLHSDALRIEVVAHQHRHPDYWKSRNR